VDEDDLGMLACVCGTSTRKGAILREAGVTHAVRQVANEVINLDLTCLDLAVKPARTISWVGRAVCGGAYHLVNVFCWTLTHCCSSGAMTD